MSRKRFFLLNVFVALVAAYGMHAHASDAVLITPDNMNGWWFFQETATGSGALVDGPSTSPLGSGSAQLTINGTGGEIFGTFAFVGTRLDTITSLVYSTYRVSGSSALAPSIQFDIDTDMTDSNIAWQGRLVYEPYYTHTVLTGTWQTWNSLDNAGTGNWWFSKSPGSVVCPINNPCTWTEVLAAFPNIGIRSAGPNTGALQFKAGGGWSSGFVGSVDAFSIGVNNAVSTYDFEEHAPPVPSPAPTGGFVVPSFVDIRFSGRAYPGATLTVLMQDVGATFTPVQQDIVTSPSGTFSIVFHGLPQGVLRAYGISIADKDGRLAQTKTYRTAIVEQKEFTTTIFATPTLGFTQSAAVKKGSPLRTVGHATPLYRIEAQIDGVAQRMKIVAGADGFYRAEFDTNDFTLGSHTIRMRQIDRDYNASEFSAAKVFRVSELPVPHADFNGDGRVNVSDWSIFLTRWNSIIPEMRKIADLNGDGKVNISDFSIFIKLFNTTK